MMLIFTLISILKNLLKKMIQHIKIVTLVLWILENIGTSQIYVCDRNLTQKYFHKMDREIQTRLLTVVGEPVAQVL